MLPAAVIVTLFLLNVLCVQRTRGAGLRSDDVYVTFLGIRLDNHSYVDSNSVGDTESSSVECHTHLHTCCSGSQGPDRGDWYNPAGEKLEFPTPVPASRVFQARGPQRVDLRRSKGYILSPGLYRCDIAVQGFRGSTLQTIYVGLYSNTAEGDVAIPDGMSFTGNSDPSDGRGSPQFTLTCISTGGPATTVTWTRDSLPLSPDSSNITSHLLDPVTAHYIHTLTLNTQPEGVYTCSVTNNKPSSATARLSLGTGITSNTKASSSPDKSVLQEDHQLQDTSWARSVFKCVLVAVAVYCVYRVVLVLTRDSRGTRLCGVMERCSIS